MARSRTRLIKRNNDIRSYYKALQEKNKEERKYLTEFLIKLTADKFYLEPRTVYQIISEPAENENQLSLFPVIENELTEQEVTSPASWHGTKHEIIN